MAHDDRTQLTELLQTWRTATASGQVISLPELCGDHPELLTELQKWVESQQDPSDPVTFCVSDTAPTRLAALPPARSGVKAGDRLGGFVLVRRLGRGGMGEVWEADEPAVPRTVAIKIMRAELANDPQLRQRFLREVRAQATVTHPNVVPLFAIGEHDGVPYFAMSLLVGETLAVRLKRVGFLPPATAIRIGQAVAEGLQAVHLAGLVHRDVKPGNVGLNAPHDGVMLLDFSIVRGADLGATDEPLTNTGMMLGTPGYMSPEQVLGAAVDARADLFSLAAVLYEMVTGVRPFQAESAFSICHALVHTQPPLANTIRPEVSPQLAELIDRMLAKNPDDRWPATAGEVASTLARFDSPEAATLTLPRRKWAKARKRSWRFAWPLVLALLLLLIPVGGFLWFGRTTPATSATSPLTAEDRLREFAGRFREQPIEHTLVDRDTNGLFKTERVHTHKYQGTTGVPIISEVTDGRATVRVPYDGEYERETVTAKHFPVWETKTARGVVAVAVTVGPDGVRVVGYEQVETDGQVIDRGHKAQRCAKAAVGDLVNRVLDGR